MELKCAVFSPVSPVSERMSSFWPHDLSSHDGENKVFEWADATISDSNAIILTPREGTAITTPRYIRYAWDGSPTINLVNESNLPLGTFELEIRIILKIK